MQPEDFISECPFRDVKSPELSDPNIDILVKAGICTKDCPYRDRCIVERIPFLMHTNGFQVRKVITEEIDGFAVNSIQFENYITDGYINELTGAID